MEELAILDELISSSSSDSASDESIDLENWDDILNEDHENHLCYPRRPIPRVQNFMQTVVANYTDKKFQENFRLKRTTFYYLLALLQEDLDNFGGFGNAPIEPERQLCIALYVLGTPDSYRSITTIFGVGKATAWKTTLKVVRALCRLRNYFITWPTPLQAQETSNILEERYGFPGVIGIVDGTHIAISAPRVDQQAYINRKGFHSIQLQVICNEKLQFVHCYAGLPGSVHDMRVFRYSGVQQNCNDQYFLENNHLMGDKAYTLQKHLMTPFTDDGHLTVEETHYNYILSSTRMTVERAIGLLKLRWRYFKDRLPMRRTDLIPYYILAICVLHNICLKFQDHFEDLDEIVMPDEVPDLGPLDVTNASKDAGAIKRDDLVRILSQDVEH